jgi:Fe2+ or Zn2+ uptake regulation protein
MSQEEVYKIIKELGGEATSQQIKQRAKEKFPGASLYQYVGDRLRKLEKNGYIKRTRDAKGNIVFKIVEEWR